ncbi:hypothetical protein [Vibrio sp. T3Y01]|uniref:hypothetical protein n=1 Tax=Vibrio sp. T3Y01 TaxID=2607606 RepID=UPI0014939452|nr:hypothetical protein [Vibrio sp. T3Y01]NOI95785.1 glycosyltransferase family 4 protein [Vibrio sp. T3Y01]
MSIFHIIVPKGISKAVFESQILSKFSGLECIFYSFSGLKELSDVKLISTTPVLSENDVIYFRSVVDYAKFKSKLSNKHGCKLIYDFRGLISEESFLKNRSFIRRFILRFLEKFAYKSADDVWTVSNNLKEYLGSRYGKRNVKVFPCKINKDWVVKRQFKDTNSINFIYVGSMSEWQCFEKVCSEYKRLMNSNTTLTVLTKDLSKANQILSKYGLSALIKSCDRDEVLDYLDRAHFGFVLRDNNLVNSTASPIKVVEYASRGVFPIMTNNVGDYSLELKGVAVNIEDTSLDIDSLVNHISQEKLDLLYDWSLKYTW